MSVTHGCPGPQPMDAGVLELFVRDLGEQGSPGCVTQFFAVPGLIAELSALWPLLSVCQLDRLSLETKEVFGSERGWTAACPPCFPGGLSLRHTPSWPLPFFPGGLSLRHIPSLALRGLFPHFQVGGERFFSGFFLVGTPFYPSPCGPHLCHQ